MRRLAIRVTLATSAAIALVAAPSATAAYATPGLGCTPIFDGGLVALVCTSATNGEVSGSLSVTAGTPTLIHLALSKCNAAGTTCTLLTESTTTQTDSVPAKPGKYYRTCADFTLNGHLENGCSPLVQAP